MSSPARWSTSAASAGVRTVALLTDMSTPLGLTAGNALEVRESLEVLAGRRPAGRRRAHRRARPRDARRGGPARRRPRRRARRRPGDGHLAPDDHGAGRRPVGRAAGRARDPRRRSPQRDGVLVRLDALAVGVAAWRLGAGRARKEDTVQAAAGIEIHAKPGAVVRGGEPLLTLHTDTPDRFPAALADLGRRDHRRPGRIAAAAPAADHRPYRLTPQRLTRSWDGSVRRARATVA